MDDLRRIVAVDYGTRRVGVAISDPLRLFAQAYGTFSPDQILDALERLASTDGIECFVVGWPLTLEGGQGKATAMVDSFVARLTARFPGIPVHRIDERFTSEMAREAIREAGARRKARRDKARVDSAAAAIILQAFLDGERG